MADEPCPFCGQPAPAGSDTCPSCFRSLLIDAVLDAPVADGKQRHELARALWQLPGMPPFAEVREHLGRAGVLATRLPRTTAASLLAALGQHGIPVRLGPHVPPPASTSRMRWVVGGSLALLLAAALGVVLAGVLLLRRPALPPPPAIGAPMALPAAPPALGIEALGKKAYAAIAEVSCQDRLGAGFFIEPEVLLTNAHVLCPGDDVSVRLQDGRQLVGSVLSRDTWIDLARVRVVGAGAAPLEPGSSTALHPGDPVVFLGSPSGLSFTLHEAHVGYVGRSYYGVGYVQLNGNISPGNSGGPVLDSQGHVVGIVTLKVTTAEAVGLALPIEYAVPPTEEKARTRWEALLAQVEADGKREAAAFELPQGVPTLVRVDLSQGVPLAVILERWPTAPHGIVERIELRRGGVAVCSVPVTFRTWQELGGKSDQVGVELRWLARYGAAHDVQVGLGAVEGPCGKAFFSEGEAALVRPDGDHGKVPLAPDEKAKARAQEERKVEAAARAVDAQQQQVREVERQRSWRKRFTDARNRIVAVDRDVARAEAGIKAMDGQMLAHGAFRLGPKGVARYQQFKAVLDGADDRRRQAEEDMAELDRQASLDDVPREWRETP